MIIPSRWFAGGKGLDDFRATMLMDSHLTKIVDYANAKDCFSGVSLSGGVCYFLWERDRQADCEFVNVRDGKEDSLTRSLAEFPILVRYNRAVDVVRSVKQSGESMFSNIISSISPFGLETKVRGEMEKSAAHPLALHTSRGISYVSRADVLKGKEWIDTHKVLISQTGSEHAGEPTKDGTFKVLSSSLKAIGHGDICTHSYILAGPFVTSVEAENCAEYLKTKFVRFLILQAMTSIHLTKSTFMFVPQQDFTRKWTDEQLYAKYALSQDDIDFIESLIKPMEVEGE